MIERMGKAFVARYFALKGRFTAIISPTRLSDFEIQQSHKRTSLNAAIRTALVLLQMALLFNMAIMTARGLISPFGVRSCENFGIAPGIRARLVIHH
jgi:hypothetical protein